MCGKACGETAVVRSKALSKEARCTVVRSAVARFSAGTRYRVSLNRRAFFRAVCPAPDRRSGHVPIVGRNSTSKIEGPEHSSPVQSRSSALPLLQGSRSAVSASRFGGGRVLPGLLPQHTIRTKTSRRAKYSCMATRSSTGRSCSIRILQSWH